jgi:hypothetical protein
MGLEPTSSQSQYNILPLELLPPNLYNIINRNQPLQEKGIEPLFLVSKTNVLPIRRLLASEGLEPSKLKV